MATYEGAGKPHTGALFKQPAQFIFTDEDTGKLHFNETTMQLLTEIEQPLNVVAITGLYRTGKSYLLNRLVGAYGGFKTGHKIHACTKGIWVWCCHHPIQKDQVLVLLDVEGFGDLEKVNRQEDIWLFTLATVLSSTLIYNNKGTLDAYALDRLNFLGQIDSTIQVSEYEEDKRLLDFDFFFPSFVVTLRDFNLELTSKSGQSLTPDEYLEDLLVQKRGKGKDVEQYNRIRLLIRRYFKTRACFTFLTPCRPKEKLENLSDSEIEPEFLKSVEAFSDYVLRSNPLQLKSGRNINGRMFANLAMHYVNAIEKNKQPSILEATRYMIRAENQVTVATASNIYKKEMQQCIAKMGDCVPKDKALVDFHELCLSKALDVFKKQIIFDDEEIFQMETNSACRDLLGQFKRICDEHSTRACQEAIRRLNRLVEKKLKDGSYSCLSGYDDYIEDIHTIVRRYTGLSGLGSQSIKLLQEYLDGKDEEEERVYRLAIAAQKGKTDPDEPTSTVNRKSIRYGDISKSFSRPESFRHSLKMKVNKLESDVTETLEQQHVEERKVIQEKYIVNLEWKIEELQRQSREQSQHKDALKEIEKQLAYLKKVYEHVKNAMEIVKDLQPDEMRKPVKKGKRRWCKIQ